MAWRRKSNKAKGRLRKPFNIDFADYHRYRQSYTTTNIKKLSAGVPTLQMPLRLLAIQSRVCKRWNGSSCS